MRLTLRTMLAYLDDILDPADAEDLRQKIEQSEFATGLVHRIRSATRRTRLGVPALDGKGMGLDPNTVAEYLDNELPPERVPDFEKICLESDVHLAEVAACHQVLALIFGQRADLGQRVDADPELKRRMQAIGSDGAEVAGEKANGGSAAAGRHPVLHDSAHCNAVPVSVASEAGADSASSAKREPPEVPEYLRVGRRSNLKTLAMAMVLAFLGCVVLLRLLGSFDSQHPLLRAFRGGTQVTERPADQPEPNGASSPAGSEPSTTPGLSRSGDGNATGPGTPGAKPETAGTEKPAPGSDAPQATVSGKPVERPPSEAAPTGKPAEVAGPPVPAAKPADKLAGEPERPGPAAAMPSQDPRAPAPKDSGSGAPAPKPEPPAPAEPVAGTAEAVVVGQLKPTTPPAPPQVLLGFNPQTGDWIRLAPPARLVSGGQLLVPPTFSPEIVLSRGVQVGFAGPSLVRPMTTSVTDEVGLSVTYCRAFMYTAGVAGARIHLDLAGRKGVVTFLDPTSECALEVKRYLPPGANPEQDPASIVIQFFSTVARIQWDDAVAGTVPIDQGQVHMIVADRAQTVAAGELPAWVRRDGLTPVDRMAAAALESFLSTDRPVSLSLKERSKDRKSEVRALAARSLTYLDFHDAAVLELADDQQRPFWAAEFDALREAVSRSPASAVRVRETLERLCGEEAATLYRLLWGFSHQQLQGRDAEQLVGYLDNDSLYMRVLAFENLRRITKKTLLYRPEANKSRRKSSFRAWQAELQNGGVVYATLPSANLSGD